MVVAVFVWCESGKVLILTNRVSHCYVAHQENWKTLAHDGFMEQVPEVERLQTW